VSLFLTPKELADLTDIRTGKDKRTREQRQIDALTAMKIPFLVSVLKRPKVARTVVEGGKPSKQQESAGWNPGLA
jgi:hypothetical protein